MATLIYLIILGAAAGFIATKVMKIETGVLPTIAIGILGALVGGALLSVFLSLLGGLIGAVIGALLIIWIWKTYFADRL